MVNGDFGSGESGMVDHDEIQLSKLAKKMLATPHKNRSESMTRNARKSIYSRAKDEAGRAALSAARRIAALGHPSEQTAIFDVETVEGGQVIYHMPYLLNPNGSVELIAA
jgi:hypothetical protein